MVKILNFGSLNLDYVYEVENFVKPGETIAAHKRTLTCGGKGLNQSIALSKANAHVFHAGSVGELDGQILIGELEKNKVDARYISTVKNTPSGNAFIQVDKSGENCIVLFGGANHSNTIKQIDHVFNNFSKNDFLVLQNEINNLGYIINKAHSIGMTIFFNASPIDSTIFKLPLQKIDYFFVNETEAELLSQTTDAQFNTLTSQFPKANFIITLGAKGAMYISANGSIFQSAYRANVIDTTAAGDTFTGYFIASLAKGKTIDYALDISAKASSITISKKGASESIPTLSEVLDNEHSYMPIVL